MKLKYIKVVIKKHLSTLLFDFISLLASVVTICLAYFHGRSFFPNNILDYLVYFVIILSFLLYFYRCYNIVCKWNQITLPKDLYFEYVAEIASNAENEIKSIAGDLSWLDKLKDTYISLAISKPNLHIVIYYSFERVLNNQKTQSLINEYKNNNINMIPYPAEILNGVVNGVVKGMLIDKDENAIFLSYSKVDNGASMKLNKYSCNTNEFHMASAFFDCVDHYVKLKSKYVDLEKKVENQRKVFIGVSGINNIGKTTLCTALKKKFGEKLAIIEDSFIGEVKQSTFEVSLFCLLNQLLDFRSIKTQESDISIFLFDRTPIDNFAFLLYYKSSNVYDRYIEHLQSEINKFMKSFDFIVLLYPAKGYKWRDTTCIKANNRKLLPLKIKNLYKNIYTDRVLDYPIHRYKNEEDLNKHINDIVEDFSKKYASRYKTVV